MLRHDLDELTSDAMRLMQMEINDLYATLGGQLLGHNLPRRAAGMVSYMSEVLSASQAKNFFDALPSGPIFTEWRAGLEMMYEELRRDGIRYLTEASGDLRTALCNEEYLRLSEQITPSAMQTIVITAGAALRIPWQASSIPTTVAVIVLKLGLSDICH